MTSERKYNSRALENYYRADNYISIGFFLLHTGCLIWVTSIMFRLNISFIYICIYSIKFEQREDLIVLLPPIIPVMSFEGMMESNFEM